MKNFFNRLKEAIYSSLPLMLGIGIPTLLAVGFLLAFNWKDIPLILSKVSYIGGGSLIYGIILCIFGFIGFLNAFGAAILWFKYVTEYLESKAKSEFGFVFPLIISSLGYIAMIIIIRRLIKME